MTCRKCRKYWNYRNCRWHVENIGNIKIIEDVDHMYILSKWHVENIEIIESVDDLLALLNEYTVTGKSLAHFFSNFSVAPLWEGGQFWNWPILSNGVLQVPDFFRGDIFNSFRVIFEWRHVRKPKRHFFTFSIGNNVIGASFFIEPQKNADFKQLSFNILQSQMNHFLCQCFLACLPHWPYLGSHRVNHIDTCVTHSGSMISLI